MNALVVLTHYIELNLNSTVLYCQLFLVQLYCIIYFCIVLLYCILNCTTSSTFVLYYCTVSSIFVLCYCTVSTTVLYPLFLYCTIVLYPQLYPLFSGSIKLDNCYILVIGGPPFGLNKAELDHNSLVIGYIVTIIHTHHTLYNARCSEV